MTKESFRSCLSCRKTDLKEVLLRFVVKDGEVVWDKNQKLPGRGAYLHSDIKCLQKISDRKIWGRLIKSAEVTGSCNLAGKEELLRLRQELIRELECSGKLNRDKERSVKNGIRL